MAANKRNVTRQEERLERVAELKALGWNQYRIAREVGVKQPQVCKDLATIKEREAKRVRDGLDFQRDQVERSLRKVQEEAWDAWEKSKKAKVKKTKGTFQGGKGGVQSVENTEVESSHGDPAMLNVVLKSLKQLSDLYGLDAPKKVSLQAQAVPWDVLSDAVKSGTEVDKLELIIEQAGRVEALEHRQQQEEMTVDEAELDRQVQELMEKEE